MAVLGVGWTCAEGAAEDVHAIATSKRRGATRLTKQLHRPASARSVAFERAADDMVVDDADRLQKRIDDRRPDEREAPPLEVFADLIGEVCRRRQVRECFGTVDDPFAIHPLPDMTRKPP